jgi:hypothetical protein
MSYLIGFPGLFELFGLQTKQSVTHGTMAGKSNIQSSACHPKNKALFIDQNASIIT